MTESVRVTVEVKPGQWDNPDPEKVRATVEAALKDCYVHGFEGEVTVTLGGTMTTPAPHPFVARIGYDDPSCATCNLPRENARHRVDLLRQRVEEVAKAREGDSNDDEIEMWPCCNAPAEVHPEGCEQEPA